jgi:signal transduction histidine kinase
MASASPLDRAFSLAELVDGKSMRNLVEDAARLCGAGVAIRSADGEILAQAGSPIEGGARVAIEHAGDQPGDITVGPCAGAGQIAQLLAASFSAIVAASWARRMTSDLHEATQAANYAELAEKNRKLAEALTRMQEVDRMKSSFLATVSHELRTPLTSVIGYSEMLLEGLAGDLSPEQREYVRTIMEKGDQLLALISNILEISRIEAGAVTLLRQPLDPAVLVEEIVVSGRAQANRRRIVIGFTAAPGLPQISVDREKMRQALVHVLGNAVKFTPEGGAVRVEVRAALGAVEIVVADSGVGISAAALPRVFDAFYQADSSSTREHGGAGLGLTIARSFIMAHQGDIRVDSAPGKGTTVTVRLPA